MTKDPERRRAQCREAQKRYEQTDKGKATMARYGRRRVQIGHNYKVVAVGKTVEEAQALRAHIQRRRREFIARQSARTEAQSD